MGDKTGIAWTDASWNPLRARLPGEEGRATGYACVKVSPGCANCYAEELNETQRWGRGTGLPYTLPALGQVAHVLDEETLTQPLRWRRGRRIFLSSMTDVFGEWVTDIQLEMIFDVMEQTPQHTYQVLTKRPERMREFLRHRKQREIDYAEAFKHTPTVAMQNSPAAKAARRRADAAGWPTIWVGVSVEDQARADERIPILLDTPAAVRFLSVEPLLEAVDIGVPTWGRPGFAPGARAVPLGLDWVIVGGESGPRARPFDLAWARSLRDQCAAAGVAFFMKQLGSQPFDFASCSACRGLPNDQTTGHLAYGCGRYGCAAQPLKLKHPHGSKPDEWPEGLRVQEFPRTAVTA